MSLITCTPPRLGSLSCFSHDGLEFLAFASYNYAIQIEMAELAIHFFLCTRDSKYEMLY